MAHILAVHGIGQQDHGARGLRAVIPVAALSRIGAPRQRHEPEDRPDTKPDDRQTAADDGERR